MSEVTVGNRVVLKGDSKSPVMLVNQKVWLQEDAVLYQCIWHDNGIIRSIAIASNNLNIVEDDQG